MKPRCMICRRELQPADDLRDNYCNPCARIYQRFAPDHLDRIKAKERKAQAHVERSLRSPAHPVHDEGHVHRGQVEECSDCQEVLKAALAERGVAWNKTQKLR